LVPRQFPSGYISDVTPHSIAEYCLRHPIGFPLSLFLLSIPVSIYASEIKAFLKIPPQGIGVWLLKARLSSSESKLRQTCQTSQGRLYRTEPISIASSVFFYFIAFTVYYTLYRMWADIRLMTHALKERHSIEKSESHIENLSKRLQLYS
jgi:hypothetical protein